MAARRQWTLAWLVQVVEQYDTRFIRAQVVTPTSTGELLSLLWDRYDSGEGREYADFQVQCYLGHRDVHTDPDRGDLWGFGHEFAPYRVDSVERARSMAAVFARVQRGLDRAERESGNLAEGDFVGYLLRVGTALRIRAYWVRNHQRQRELTGNPHQRVTASTLQWWMSETQTIARERPAELDHR
jgi:hypothetical protein